MESTEGKTKFSLTVVGATGLSPSDDNHPTRFYVVVEVDGKQGRTAELAPSPQSTIEWNACFPLQADKASYIALRLYECQEAVRPGHLRGGKSIWESRATAEQLLGSGSNFTNMTLPARAPYEEGHLVVKVERTAHTEGERPVVGESSVKPWWQGEMRELEPSAVRSVHDFARNIYSDFEETHDREKLEQAIDHYRVSLDLRPAGNSNRSTSLNNLALALYTRFNEFGDRADLDKSMELFRAALAFGPPGHPDHSASMNNLAFTFSTRFKRFGDRADLNEAVQLNRAALADATPGHPDHSTSLNNLADTLSTRFNEFGGRADLDEAMELLRAALALCPPGHSNHFMSLNNLALALSIRFKQFGDRADLGEAMRLFRAALELCPPGHPDYSTSLNNLADTLSTRFDQLGDRVDLDEAMELLRAALALRPPGHPNRSTSLNNLASTLSTRFDQFGDGADLDEAIELFCGALVLHPPGHPKHSASLNNLTDTLSIRFKEFGDRADLDEAMQLNRAALPLHPPGHLGHSTSLSNLASTLSIRFDQFGHRADLDEAMELNRAALALHPPGHPKHSTSLRNLASTLSTRFKRFGDRADLDEAMELLRAALALCPPGHPNHSTSLNNLAVTISTRFDQFGDRADLDEVTQLNCAVLALCPPGHPGHSTSLNNVASTLSTRFDEFGDKADLDKAMELLRVALALHPPGHPKHSTFLRNLASTLSTRFKQFGDGADLDEATELNRTALALCPSGHPDHSTSLSNLASTLSTRFKQFGDRADLDIAFQYHELASTDTTCGSWDRVKYSLTWIRVAEAFQHDSTLNAYRISLANLDRHVILRSSIVSRHEILKTISSSLAANAASCALRRNEPATAVELLEQGRGVIWTQMANLHTPLQHLSDVNAQGKMLATDLRRIGSELDRSSRRLRGDEKSSIRDEEARRHRCLAEEWDSVVCNVRRLEGFSRFLLPLLYSDLQHAAVEGPVVIINAGKYSCDALIVLQHGPPHHIPLRNITLEDVTQMESDFARVLRSHSNFSVAGHENSRRNELFSLLRSLWGLVVYPIVHALWNTQVPAGSRIWLCPTFKFTSLPLHAAGPYRKGELGLSDLYITSYTPTLSALIRTRKNKTIASAITPKLAAIGQAKPGGGSHEKELLAVNAELDLVLRQLPSSVPSTRLADTAATNRAALDALCKHSWVHLACHGKQDMTQPFNSCFSMHDKPLSLLDIMRTDISHPELAFLSACHTAVGDANTPDEVIHLAAGMQFVGFKSVIGTMWAVDDSIAHHMVSAFYKSMFEHGMDYTKAAASLNIAMRTVDKKAVPLEQRIVFVHIGA